MHNSIFDKLNDSQREAALHGTGPMLVSAGPGSGKTSVIVARLLELIINKKIPPEKILVITFTREAALSMRSRFFQSIQNEKNNSYSIEHVCFGTFHSFFYQILRGSTKYSEYKIIDSQTKNRILSHIIMKLYPKDYSKDLVQRFSIAIGFFKNTLNMDASKNSLPFEFQHDFRKVLNQYDAKLDSSKQMDFDDLQFLCLELLKSHKTLRIHWQERFSYILMDEFQDCNPISFEILKLISKAPYNLFAVGDDDQAIYGFRGADSNVMPRFLTSFPGTKQVVLNVNYRSFESIVNASLNVIRENKYRLEKEFNAFQKDENNRVFVKGFPKEMDCLDYVSNILKEKGIEELEECAILFRTNRGLGLMADRLKANGIPFYVEEQYQSIYEHFIVKDIIEMAQLASGKLKSRGGWYRILSRCGVHISRESMFDRDMDLETLKEYFRLSGKGDVKIYKDLCKLESKLHIFSSLEPKMGLRFLRSALGYDAYLRRKSLMEEGEYEEWMPILDWLEEGISQFMDWNDFIEYVYMCLEKEQEDKRILVQKSARGVKLLTIHGSKGLEFKHVFIIGVNEGNIPKTKQGQILSEEALEEERRLLYVGMTRAKETLELLYQTGTKEAPKSPSRFIHMLLEK